MSIKWKELWRECPPHSSGTHVLLSAWNTGQDGAHLESQIEPQYIFWSPIPRSDVWGLWQGFCNPEPGPSPELTEPQSNRCHEPPTLTGQFPDPTVGKDTDANQSPNATRPAGIFFVLRR